MELNGYLQELTPFYSRYQFQPLVSSSEILSRFEDERRQFLIAVFKQAHKAKTWFHIDLDEAAEAIDCPRDRIVRALDYLAEQGLLEVRAEGVRNRFSILRRPDNLDRLTDVLFQNALELERREVERIGQVIKLGSHDGCQVAHLAAHFGEKLSRLCGHCAWCLNGHQPAGFYPRNRGQLMKDFGAAPWCLARSGGADRRCPGISPICVWYYLSTINADSPIETSTFWLPCQHPV